MSVTQIAVIYSVALSKLRRVIIPSIDDSELAPDNDNLMPGEAVFLMQISDYTSENIDIALGSYLGKPALDDRCAVIDSSGNVIAVIRADPFIDSMPGYTLILDDDADIGWTYSNGMFSPPPSN